MEVTKMLMPLTKACAFIFNQFYPIKYPLPIEGVGQKADLAVLTDYLGKFIF
jgi:hypothetical protein